MKIAHVSADKRYRNGKLSNSGGVENFAWMLHKAIGCDILTPGERDLREYDIVIADSYYTPPPLKQGQKCISVTHGILREWCSRTDKTQDFVGDINRQHQVWNDKRIKVVCCSNADKKYLKQHHGREADAVILHGVDTELFKPNELRKSVCLRCYEETSSRDCERCDNCGKDKLLVMHTATNYCKTAHGKLDRVGNRLQELGFRFEFMNRFDDKRFERIQEADVYFNCSLHEGNSYALNEFMSCNIPIVGSRTGLLEDTDFSGYNIGERVDWQASEEEYVQAVLKVANNLDKYNPRKWVMDNAMFEIFANNWIEFLEGL